MRPRRLLVACCRFSLLILAAGCGVGTLDGTVTYDGKDVEFGYIYFFPAEAEEPPVKAEIRQGKYRVRNLGPGRRVVRITTDPFFDGAPGAGKDGVPANAGGNNVPVDPTGRRRLDFALTPPPETAAK